MAKVLGESGRYVSNEAVRKRNQYLLLGMVVLTFLGLVEGFIISLAFRPNTMSPIVHSTFLLAILLLVLAVFKFGSRKLSELDKLQDNYLSGARGENIVGTLISKFPDNFCVINDLKTPFGNIDHVVIGPTGVFVLDTKNWRGVVAADGKGELLLNGKPTTKREIRNFTVRLMSVREKVNLLAPDAEAFHAGLFVFTSARIDARWGTTGNVHCLNENQLYDYIVEKDFGKRLNKEEVEQIARAFLGLAHMDAGFQQLPLNRKTREPALVHA